MAVLRELVLSQGVSALVATHDPLLLDAADVVVELRDGRVTGLHANGPVATSAS
jgi:putative ABC transport system ATP-binding protein